MKRAYRVAGLIGVVVIVILGVAWANVIWYQGRRFSRCGSAMGPLLAGQATRAEVARALGGQAYASYSQAQAEDLAKLARGWNQKVEFIRAQASVSPSTDVVLVGDMVHFVFYDAAARVRGYVCVGN